MKKLKLKLNKETVALLDAKNQKMLNGGEVTGEVTCKNYTVQAKCYFTEYPADICTAPR